MKSIFIYSLLLIVLGVNLTPSTLYAQLCVGDPCGDGDQVLPLDTSKEKTTPHDGK